MTSCLGLMTVPFDPKYDTCPNFISQFSHTKKKCDYFNKHTVPSVWLGQQPSSNPEQPVDDMHHTSDFAQQIPLQTPAAISLNLLPAMEEVLTISFTLSFPWIRVKGMKSGSTFF